MLRFFYHYGGFMSFLGSFLKCAELKSTVNLQPHQEAIREKLKNTDGLLLYHGLGSGKTLSSIAATEVTGADVVVPASLRENYAKEIKNYTNGKTKRNIMSYEKATKGGLPGGDALVLDEAQRLNASDTKRTKAIIDAAPNYKKRILLSGTPIRNHPSEFAPLLRILDPSSKVPLNKDDFSKRFIQTKKTNVGLLQRLRGVRPGEVEDIRNPEEFRSLVRGRVHYHGTDKSNFPHKQERTVGVPMSDDQKKVYDTVTGKANPALAYKVRKNMPMSKQESRQLNAFMTAARVVSNTTKPYGGMDTSPKLIRAADDFLAASKKDPNFKGYAYSNYLKGGVDEYSKLLDARGIKHHRFTGEIGDKERKQVVDDYNQGRVKALLLSGAGAEGLDLKGTKMVQMLEPHWNKARTDQAIGRGVRYKSHEHLPEKERNVDVVHYHSTIPQGRIAKFFGRKPETSSDQYLANLSNQKHSLNEKFLDILRQEGSR
jgi:hypothetical protein